MSHTAIKTHAIGNEERKVVLSSPWPTPNLDTGYDILKKERTKRKRKKQKRKKEARCSRKFGAQQ